MTVSTAAHSPGTASATSQDRDPASSRLWLISAVLAVLFAYSLPFLLSRARHGPLLNVAFADEKIYLARVMDAYRGGSLGNPYFVEHQNAERYMPELAERLLASIAHVSRVDPLIVVAVSRVLLPLSIYTLLWSIARGLGMDRRLATLAALLPTLRPVIFGAGTISYDAGFFRYFRVISPAFYVLLLLVALRAVEFARKKAVWWIGLLAGATLGLLFYGASLYFWAFAVGGVAWLAVAEEGRVRATLLTSIGAALVIGVPFFVKTLHQEYLPDLQATLGRLGFLTPGRAPDARVSRILILAVPALVCIWLWRRKMGDGGRFLVPFMAVGTVLMIQNVVTNRGLLSFHWVECLIPVWSLAAVALIHGSNIPFRAGYLAALLAVWAAGAFFSQANAYRWWTELERERPEFWALDARMPCTLEWLNRNTPANSVVIASPDVMDSLVIFTHNKVYWAYYGKQHIVSESEVEARWKSLESWRPASAVRLPFRADFYLGTGRACLNPDATKFLYRDQAEGTCVLAVSGPA